MNTEKFIINDRFIADANRNVIWDKKNNIETRLEPRLVRLLFILIDKQGEVVTREFLAEEIWDNYLGANEGLSQAISFLRKLLDDGEKKMIRTLPKKGYSFHAVIGIPPEKGVRKFRLQGVNKMLAAAFLIILCLNIFYLVHNMASSTAKKQAPPDETLKEKGERDAENKAVLFFNMDSRQQAAKKLRESATPDQQQ